MKATLQASAAGALSCWLVLAAGCLSFEARAQPAAVRVEAVVAQGRLSGVSDGSVESFKGIPYAAPPIGALRWKPPQPAAGWSGTRDATDYGHACMQDGPPPNVPGQSAAAVPNEDCLTLNVWAPAKPGTKRPVFVWIHGGGNVQGSGAGRYLDGSAFARDGIVAVTINYRLGIFGFFATSALEREAGTGGAFGNYGLLDQVAALRWIRANAAAFGGDPDNVTVAGESAGGEDIAVLLTVPSAAGAFDKAIVESGGFWTYLPSLASAESASEAASAKLGIRTGDASALARLRALDAASLEKIPLGDDGAQPMIDGRFVREAPLDAVRAGRTLAVPLLIGSNDDEASLIRESATVPPFVEEGLSAAQIAAARAAYGAAASSETAFGAALFRDRFFAAPARLLAAVQSHRARAYLYRFAYVLDALRARRGGAYHGSEIPYVFDSWPLLAQLSAADQAETATLHACWSAFAQSGVPACAGAPAWPAYDVERDELIQFATKNVVVATPFGAVLEQLLPARS